MSRESVIPDELSYEILRIRGNSTLAAYLADTNQHLINVGYHFEFRPSVSVDGEIWKNSTPIHPAQTIPL